MRVRRRRVEWPSAPSATLNRTDTWRGTTSIGPQFIWRLNAGRRQSHGLHHTPRISGVPIECDGRPSLGNRLGIQCHDHRNVSRRKPVHSGLHLGSSQYTPGNQQRTAWTHDRIRLSRPPLSHRRRHPTVGGWKNPGSLWGGPWQNAYAAAQENSKSRWLRAPATTRISPQN